LRTIEAPGNYRQLVVSEAFDTYWRYAAERQLMYFRRLRGDAIWTLDSVLQNNRFTNVYRASDRVSQFLISHVIPNAGSSVVDKFLRVILFKIFNKIETWQLLERELGPIHAENFDEGRYSEVLAGALSRGERIYSAAYIMPSPQFGNRRKHDNHLSLMRWMLEHRIPERFFQAKTLEDAYEVLLGCPSLGTFLAFQFAIDLNYCDVTSFSEMSFVVPGPGALDGIRKCFLDTGGFMPADLIRFMSEIAPREFSRLNLDFVSLWGRPLQLIDCLNLFCEVDKYCRAVHPELVGASGRTRIKQRYQGRRSPLSQPVFPPSWQLDTERLPEASKVQFARSA
jgi:hypothetical protein